MPTTTPSTDPPPVPAATRPTGPAGTTTAPSAAAAKLESAQAQLDAACVALWSWNVDTDAITMDDRAYELWAIAEHDHYITFETLSQHIHPADRDRVRAAFAATRGVIGSYETDFRIVLGHEVRWISARGQGADGRASAGQ